MVFLWPEMLWLLLAAPVLVALYVWLQQRRKRILASYSSFGLNITNSAAGPGLRRHISAVLFLVAILILVLSLARPQLLVNLPNVEGTVILAFDVSGSMAADDVKPTRMETAKNVARELVLNQPTGVQVGMVVFSDGGFSINEPTDDQEEILSAIDQLMPERGTSMGNGILVSLDVIAAALGDSSLLASGEQSAEATPTPMPEGKYSPAVIVMLSDGENTISPDPREAAHTAAERGVRIHTIGVGTPAGVVLEINDFVVHTQLNEEMLQQISLISGGSYYSASNDQDLNEIFNNLDLQLVTKEEQMEVTSLLAGTSIVLLLIGGLLSLLWFSRLP